ncbi:Ger(x)C family spore germination protein [Paenibacillus montanisoli]|uniref:Ger(X)C family spore germination protein n=1 Tax=Paenibacillus montanisoli TaxID=2081970 RepID=A0A328U1M9_9BACL|nr:Ger(x)C family spore germination protein [Paenibacillus montanisoli]RAP76550.1 Ger(x)C family spore germination protein [Paenibacillus montanisoli]
MFRKMMFILLFLFMLLIMTGCWNRRELSDLAIAGAIGIDEAGDQVRVSVQVLNPGEITAKKGGSQRSPISTYSEQADTVFEALRKLTTIVPRKIYSSHIRLIVIGESLARKGIGPDLELFYRDQELRPTFYVLVARKTTAENLLKVLTSNEKIPAESLFHSLETSESVWAPTATVNMGELVRSFEGKGKAGVLTGVQVKGNVEFGASSQNLSTSSPPTTLHLSSLSVFRRDKLIGWLDEEESKGYSYITDKVKSSVGYVSCPDGGKVVVEIVRSKSEIKWKRNSIAIRVRVEDNVAAQQCKLDLTDPRTIPELEKKASEKIKAIMKKTLNEAQHNYHADIFGFGEAIYRSDPHKWNQLKQNWDDTFSELPVQLDVKVKIRYTGVANKSYLKDIKE